MYCSSQNSISNKYYRVKSSSVCERLIQIYRQYIKIQRSLNQTEDTYLPNKFKSNIKKKKKFNSKYNLTEV